MSDPERSKEQEKELIRRGLDYLERYYDEVTGKVSVTKMADELDRLTAERDRLATWLVEAYLEEGYSLAEATEMVSKVRQALDQKADD